MASSKPPVKTPSKPPVAEVVVSEGPPSRRTLAMATTWSGPIPPAAMLREYEDAFPGTAERILTVFETEGSHRRAQDVEAAKQSRLLVEAQVFVMKFGAVSTAVIALGGIIVASILAMSGQYPLAAAIGGGELVGLTVLGVVRRPKNAPPQLPENPKEER